MVDHSEAPNQSAVSSATATVGRNTATVADGWPCRHSAASRSTSALWVANPNDGLGRSGASSVSGTGLSGHAP